MVMARGDLGSVSILLGCINSFSACSGLKPSRLKSSMFAAGIPMQELSSIQQLAGFGAGVMPFTYLGVPIAAARLSVIQFQPVLNKLEGYLSVWSGSSLSYAGPQAIAKSPNGPISTHSCGTGFASTVHQLWLLKNAKYFEGADTSIQQSIRRIKLQLYTVVYSFYPSVVF